MQQTVLLGGGGCLYDQSCVNEFRTVDNYMCLQGLFQGLSLKAKAGTKDLSPVLKESLQRRVDYKLACFVFSSLSGHAPQYLADDIRLVSEVPRRRLRSSTDRLCAVPRTHNTFGDRSFAVAGPRVWNSLPVHLRDEDITYNSFRRELKTLFVSRPY